ncbi:phosphoribosylglycinamide formyltransferase [candidate division FCPU426 bacterium]|nr:phosphoribosylglycinamide formyltransferase [candidate division FCPU426 bacterium]
MKTRIAVMVSGGGTNLQALLDAWKSGQFNQAEISLVVSNQEKAKALDRARAVHVPALFLNPAQYKDRQAYDQQLLKSFQENKIDLICLAGYMRILTTVIVRQYEQRIMNIHPALLPAFGGEGMYGLHVHEAVMQSGAKYSGCTVHFVDEGTDTGPIILQAVVPVLDHDTPDKLAERVLIEEHRLYPRAVSLFCEGRLQVAGKRVLIKEKA